MELAHKAFEDKDYVRADDLLDDVLAADPGYQEKVDEARKAIDDAQE
jgi:uncharacterized protein (UPF0297 family)